MIIEVPSLVNDPDEAQRDLRSVGTTDLSTDSKDNP
jgi:hypothetical protein